MDRYWRARAAGSVSAGPADEAALADPDRRTRIERMVAEAVRTGPTDDGSSATCEVIAIGVSDHGWVARVRRRRVSPAPPDGDVTPGPAEPRAGAPQAVHGGGPVRQQRPGGQVARAGRLASRLPNVHDAYGAEAEQGRQVAETRRQERTRIAREMHDVLAYRLSLLATYDGAPGGGAERPQPALAGVSTAVRVLVVVDALVRAGLGLR